MAGSDGSAENRGDEGIEAAVPAHQDGAERRADCDGDEEAQDDQAKAVQRALASLAVGVGIAVAADLARGLPTCGGEGNGRGR